MPSIALSGVQPYEPPPSLPEAVTVPPADAGATFDPVGGAAAAARLSVGGATVPAAGVAVASASAAPTSATSRRRPRRRFLAESGTAELSFVVRSWSSPRRAGRPRRGCSTVALPHVRT